MGGKRKAREGRSPKGADAAVDQHALVGLLNGAHAAVEQALDVVTTDPAVAVAPLDDRLDAGPPCGPTPRRNGPWAPIVDPLLLDRYEGLLTRSGIVAGSVHHLPSRLRERTEGALRELVVGVARDRAATGPRVDALVDELLTLIGQRIACGVEDWRDPVD